MTARTDIHRPSAEEFDPEAYDCAGCFDLNPEPGDMSEVQRRMLVVSSLVTAGHKFTGVNGMGSCDHCGASVRYAALMIHTATKGMIWIGEQCLGNRFALNKSEFQTLRKNASLNRERRKKSERIAEILNTMTAEVRAAYDWALTKPEAEGMEKIGEGPAAYFVTIDWDSATPAQRAARSDKGWGIAFDIAAKVAAYVQPLSVKQEAFIVKLHGEWTEKAAKRAAEAAAIQAGTLTGCPVGRVTITGTIASCKFVDSDFGGGYKMTVVSDEGFRVYGSAPRSLENTDKGARVEFSATVEPSKDDARFGFFSRPTKAKNLPRRED